jgi:hypothetical protein
MIALFLLLSLSEPPAALVTRAAARLDADGCAGVSCGARARSYRVDAESAGDATPKDRAVRETGVTCSIVGARVCTRPPRTILSAPLER